ncbi:hypothetical protein BLNAU_15159 [Blattamonas nauphoetae]|uniref:Uncharacterized protein n=1 Tax=Blattamonas nauphoetae TaxID=2049346 RepID=A0ABQ9XIB8_9EUKA|nr:hypothetical protein BLNAU_15159 [Blattamonas nauphoetae]
MIAPRFGNEAIPSTPRHIITANEKDPVGRFNELLVSLLDPNEPNIESLQQLAIFFLQRYLNHVTDSERKDLLHRFGETLSHVNRQHLDIPSLSSLVSSDEDSAILCHSSGLSFTFLQELRQNNTDQDSLEYLAQLSEIIHIGADESHSEALISLLGSFLCDPLQYLGEDAQENALTFTRIVDILSNEFLASAITGDGQAVYECVLTHFPTFSRIVETDLIRPLLPSTNFEILQTILKISQKVTVLFSIFRFLGVFIEPHREDRCHCYSRSEC